MGLASLERKLVADTLYLLGRTAVLRVLQIPVLLVTARVLGPEGLGLLRIIDVIPSLAKYGKISFTSVTVREVSQVTDSEGRLIDSLARDVAYSASILWAILLTILVGAGSFVLQTGPVQTGTQFAALAMFAMSIQSLYATNCQLVKNFKLMATSSVIGEVLRAIFVLTTITFLGIYAPLIAAAIGALITAALLHRQMPLGITFRLDRQELWRQTRIAVPLSLGTLAFGLESWVERGTIAALWGLDRLGNYMILISLLQAATLFINNFLEAFAVHLYQRLGTRDGPVDTERMIRLPTLTFATIIPLFAALMLFWGPFFLTWLLPQFTKAVPLIPWAGVILWLGAIPSLYITAMYSTRLDQQVISIFLRLAATAVFSLTALFLWHSDWDVEGAIVGRLASTATMAITPILLTARVFHPGPGELRKALVEYLAPGIWGLLLMVGLTSLPMGTLGELLLKPLLFLLLYLPALLRWEKQCLLISRLIWPKLRGRLVRNKP
ncbi:MAG: oligosaccharide flippase family protein [Magnetococcales bacterium]|nr:oligosaccharide flippase family protein [Magnetococcales bacterium]